MGELDFLQQEGSSGSQNIIKSNRKIWAAEGRLLQAASTNNLGECVGECVYEGVRRADSLTENLTHRNKH